MLLIGTTTNNYHYKLMESSHKTWGKAEVETIIKEQREKGNHDVAQEIKRTIKNQEKELISYEVSMINTSIMLITALAGYLARKATA